MTHRYLPPTYAIDRGPRPQPTVANHVRSPLEPLQTKRCGRTIPHAPHTWVQGADATDDHCCDGRVGPRTAAQLLVEHPALRTLPHAGAFLAEGDISA